MAIIASPRPARSEVIWRSVVWTSPGTGLWVANSASRFVGKIEERCGSFSVTDETGRSVGRFATLATSMNALRRADHLTIPGILRRDGLAGAAVSLGLVAFAVAAYAIPVYLR